MSTPQLKKLAADCHLNTKCTRNSLIAKHKEFVIRYNADIDAGRPPDSKSIATAIEREDNRKQVRFFLLTVVNYSTKSLWFSNHFAYGRDLFATWDDF